MPTPTPRIITYLPFVLNSLELRMTICSQTLPALLI
jgi:hypothetical protein